MYCTQCRTETRDTDRFCGQCGSTTGVEGAPGATYAPHASYAPHATYAPPPPAGPPKRLVLSRSDKKVGGVCAGFADYLGWDVTIVRLLYLCGVVYSCGLALLAYLIAWIVIPAEPQPVYAGGLPAVRSA